MRDCIDTWTHIAIVTLFIVKDVVGLPDAINRANLAIRKRQCWHLRLIALLPEEIVGWARLERAVWKGFFGWITRTVPSASPQGLHIDFLRRSTYPIVFSIILLALLIDIPFCGMIVGLIEQDRRVSR